MSFLHGYHGTRAMTCTCRNVQGQSPCQLYRTWKCESAGNHKRCSIHAEALKPLPADFMGPQSRRL